MEGGTEEKMLLSLKKELKSWESLFHRKHGRKPFKVDIEESPVEIREAYQQYRQLKSQQISTNGTVNWTAPHSKTTPPEPQDKDEVFGPTLNKPPKARKVETAPAVNKEVKAVWKVRRWTKDRGYVNVTVKRDNGIAGGASDSVMGGAGEGVTSGERVRSDSEKEATAASMELELDRELRTLTQELKLSSKSTSKCPSRPVVSGECQNVLLAQRRAKTRLASRISTHWLGRCRSELELNGEGCGTLMEVEKEKLKASSTNNTESQGESPSSHTSAFLIRETLDIDDDVTTWSGDDLSGQSADSSDEEESAIRGQSARLRWSELSTAKFISSCSSSGLAEEKALESALVSSAVSSECSSAGCESDFSGPGSHSIGGYDKPVPKHSELSNSINNASPKSALGMLEMVSGSSAHMHSLPANKAGPISKQSMFYRSSVGHPNEKSIQSPSTHRNRTASALTDGLTAESSVSLGWCRPNSITTSSDNLHVLESSPITRSTSDEVENYELGFSEAELAEIEQMEMEIPPPSPSVSKPPEEESDNFEPLNTKTNPPKKSVPKPTSTSLPSSSAVSGNFVRLNMKVKRFSRKRGLTGSAHKRLAWKKIQKSRAGSVGGSGRGVAKSGQSMCFKCGSPGHWARNCDAGVGSKNLGKFDGEEVGFSDKMATGEDEELDQATLEQLAKDSPFPSVEDAALMARGVKFDGRKIKQSTQSSGGVSQSEEVSVNGGEGSRHFVAPPSFSRSIACPRSVQPLFPTVDSKIPSTPSSVYSALRRLGYDSFRPGQEEAVMRVLSGVSTLLINSTGSGKSLCYQLPAFLYSQSSSSLALVVSPLVSLMEDQVHHFPSGVRGGCLHTSQTRTQRDKVLKEAVEGKLNVLLLSPEALVGGALWSKGGGGAHSLNQLPPVAFACIDEAHCVSEWSHNFRPSYLRVYKVLRERLGVYCVLALTATATYQTAVSVATNLGIAPENIIRGPTLPDNLHISVSCDEDRDQALVELLQSKTFRCLESIIIYCTRQQETERVAQLLRTCLSAIPGCETGMDHLEWECDQEVETSKNRKRKTSGSKKGSKRQKVDWSAESYHAGMQASRRRKVQSDFMSGRLRIVVATVAFGMGLNKSDVRAIIHYNLPKSFESFVQEIGRAGRDGLPAYCHVFIDKMGGDLAELRRHAYSNSVDRYCIKQLVSKVYPSCQCKEQKESSGDGPSLDSSDVSSLPRVSHPRWCNGHEVAVPIKEMVTSLDIKEECIFTMLCYLELEDWLEVMNPINDSCTLRCYSGARQLRALAGKVPAVAAATARLREKGTDLTQSSSITFSVAEVADSMGWESHIVRSELSGLSVNDRGTGGPNTTTSSVLVEFGTLSFRLLAPGDLTPDERDTVCEFLHSKVKGQEEREIEKLHLFHAVLCSVACQTHEECFSNVRDSAVKQSTLNELIRQYFSKESLHSQHLQDLSIPILRTRSVLSPEQERQVCDDISALISIHSEHRFTGRAIARIFHGIASPLFEAVVWGGQKRFWRRHMDTDFNLLCQLATRELLNFS